MDLEAMLRHAREFDFSITAFHHVHLVILFSNVALICRRLGLRCMASARNDKTGIRNSEVVRFRHQIPLFSIFLINLKEYYYRNIRNALGLQKRRYFPDIDKQPIVLVQISQFKSCADISLAYQANPWAGKILSENNIPVAYKSDHPVQMSWWV